MIRRLLSRILPILLIAVGFPKLENEFCDTLLTEEQIRYELERKKKVMPTEEDLQEEIKLSVSVHIVQSSGGEGGIDFQSIYKAFEKLNESLKSIYLSFEICNFYTIDNNRLFNFDKYEESELSRYAIDSTLNIFFVNSITSEEGEDICGYTYYPTSQNKDFIVLSNLCMKDGTSLPHEVGHYLGLYHTHESKFGVELESGTNCLTAGDLICDTPPDLGNYLDNISSDCQYESFLVNPVSPSRVPPFDNYMSYSKKSCRTRYTLQQLEKMRLNYHFFKTYLKKINMQFSKFKHLIVQGDSVNLWIKGGYSRLWNNGKGEASIWVKPDSSSEYSVTVKFSSGCTVFKEFEVKVISGDSIDYPKQICLGEDLSVSIHKSEPTYQYFLTSRDSIISPVLNGNDSTLTFLIKSPEQSIQFFLNIQDGEGNKTLTLNKAFDTSVLLPIPKTIALQYDSTVVANKAHNIYIKKSNLNYFYQLYRNGKATGKVFKGNGGSLIIRFKPNDEKRQYYDLKVFNDCHQRIFRKAIRLNVVLPNIDE